MSLVVGFEMLWLHPISSLLSVYHTGAGSVSPLAASCSGPRACSLPAMPPNHDRVLRLWKHKPKQTIL